MLGALVEDERSGEIQGEIRLPEPGSPVIDAIPEADCHFGPFDDAIAQERHLEDLIEDRLALIGKDQRGVSRPQGPACDAGAVEVEP
jgi:hypothetical protein